MTNCAIRKLCLRGLQQSFSRALSRLDCLTLRCRMASKQCYVWCHNALCLSVYEDLAKKSIWLTINAFQQGQNIVWHYLYHPSLRKFLKEILVFFTSFSLFKFYIAMDTSLRFVFWHYSFTNKKVMVHFTCHKYEYLQGWHLWILPVFCLKTL